MEPKQSVDQLRTKWLSELPRWYLPFGHLAATTGICAFTIVAAAYFLESPGYLAVPVVLANLVFANFSEWFAHRYLMHRRQWPMQVLYEKHTVMHHRLYREDTMALKDWRELALVLVPSAGVLGVLIAGAAVDGLLALAFGTDVGLLSVITQAAYTLTYELTHLSYHLPVGHPLHRLPILKKLSRQHARHHDPRIMNRYNFNVTVPLMDWLLGTLAPRKKEGQ